MLPPLHIIIDSREQAPWSWDQSDATVEIAGLVAGDYALAQDTEVPKRKGALRPVRFALERKSLDDFAQSVSSNYERLLREMDRALTWPARIIIGEFDLEHLCFSQIGNDLIPPPHNHPQLRPSFMFRRIAELAMMNITVLPCGDAQKASAMALHIFRRRFADMAGLSQ
jgi:hypothetical protein